MPAVASSSPAQRPSSVVLPLPDGPMIAQVSPGGARVDVAQHRQFVARAAVGFAQIRISRMGGLTASARVRRWRLLIETNDFIEGLRFCCSVTGGALWAADAPMQTPQRPRRIVVLGDSITAGYGLDPARPTPRCSSRKSTPPVCPSR